MLISYESNTDFSVENCFGSEISEIDSIVLRGNNVLDTARFSFYGLLNDEVMEDFAACNLPGDWSVYNFNDHLVPCELEPSFLRFHEKGAFNSFQLSGSAVVKGDTVLPSNQLVSFFIYPTADVNNFSDLVTGFFSSKEKAINGTTKLIIGSILNIEGPLKNSTHITYNI